VRNGEYKLTFRGTRALEARRKAIGYWYDHRHCINLTLREFLARCRPVADESGALAYWPKGATLPEGEPSEPTLEGALCA
jgi:hypothetical protein